MEKNLTPAQEAQGAAEATNQALTVDLVKEYLKKDISVAISCLNAIQSDPDLLDTMAHFMQGRFLNARHSQKSPE